ncbi:leucoanthocyanidin reductase-like [Wolffia australiana]
MGEARGSGATLIVGSTGFIGRFVTEASLALRVPTYVLRRPGSADPAKEASFRSLELKGAVIVQGSADDKQLIIKILKEKNIEVVISVIGGRNLADQFSLIEAIQSTGTVRRFLPSEFGNDVDRANPVEPGSRVYEEKREIRKAIEAAGVPFTYICCNSIASWPFYDQYHHSEAFPPLDKLAIYGDGDMKAYFVTGPDIGKFTIKAAHDIHTLNKTVHFRPNCNFLSMNELGDLWEKRIGRTLPRVTIPESALLAAAAENKIPESFVASFIHDVFFRGCHLSFSIDGRRDVEVSQLYPDVPFQTIEDWLEGCSAYYLNAVNSTEEKLSYKERSVEKLN